MDFKLRKEREAARPMQEKVCKECHRTLSETYPHELCPICMERHLFNDVREYIRNNDVREHEVAEKFNIPISRVREWIREGRIQYKGDSVKSISGVNCRYCGKPIAFGVACPSCHSLQNLKVVANMKKSQNDESMRFLGKNKVDD